MKKNAVARLFELARAVSAWSARGRNFELDQVIGPRSPRGGVGMPVLFDTGMSNIDRSHIFGKTIGRDYGPTWHQYFNDFDTYAAGDWTITDTGIGTSALLALSDGGALKVNNANAGNGDLRQHQLVQSSFLIVAGKPCLFSARLSVDNATLGLFAVGLQLQNANAFAPPADGIWFLKGNNGNANIDFKVASAAAGLLTTAAIGVAVDATMIELNFVYDGEKAVHYGINGKELGVVTDANVPVVNGLAPVFAVKNGSAVARFVNLDWIYALKFR